MSTGRPVQPIKPLALPTIAKIKDQPHVHEAFRTLEDHINQLQKFVEDVTGTGRAKPPGSGPPGTYVPQGLISFDNENNLIAVPTPPFPDNSGGGGGGSGSGGGDGNGPGTGGRRALLANPKHAEFQAVAGEIGARNGARIIVVHSQQVVTGINGARRGQPLAPASILVVLMETREPAFDHFEVECWSSNPSETVHIEKQGVTMTAPGAWDATTKTFKQVGHIEFPNLDGGAHFAFKARVATVTTQPSLGAVSDWSDWAYKIAGDTAGPNPTYAPTTELVAGQLVLSANPSGAPNDTSGYRFFIQRRSSPAGITVHLAPNTSAPTIITTLTPHGLVAGEYVQIENALGNTAINGYWPPITFIDATHFSINTAGNGSYVADSATCESAPTDDTPPSTPLIPDAKTPLPLVGLDVDDVWIRAVDTDGNKQQWTYLGAYTLPAPKVFNITLTQTLTFIQHAHGKSPAAQLNVGLTTPNDPYLEGLAFYLYNRDNAGKMELLERHHNVPINASLAFELLSRLDSFSGPSQIGPHDVKLYIVSILVNGLEAAPVSNQPFFDMPNGIDGAYTGPAAPSSLVIENAGNDLYLEWDDSFDPMILEYWIPRAPDGTHNSPGAGISVTAASYSSGLALITTASPHGRSVGDLVMIDGSTGFLEINGCFQLSAIGGPTQLAFPIPSITPGAYTGGASLWVDIRRVNQPHAVIQGSNDDGAGQTYLDKNFAVSDYDPANPKRFRYWIAARTSAGQTSAYTAGAAIELIPDPSGINQPDPLASVLNRLFNAMFLSNAAASNILIDGSTDGQTTPPGDWGAWFGGSSGAGQPPKWVSDGTAGTGEAVFPGAAVGSGDNSFLQQNINSKVFEPGEVLDLSIYLRTSDATKQTYQIGLGCARIHAGTPFEVFTGIFNASILTTDYQRFNFSLRLGSGGWTNPSGDQLQFSLGVLPTGPGTTPDIFALRPMLNDGLTPANWTSMMDINEAPGASRRSVSVRPVTTPTPPALVRRDVSAPTWGT